MIPVLFVHALLLYVEQNSVMNVAMENIFACVSMGALKIQSYRVLLWLVLLNIIA